ncbi:hypothetical protein AWB91_09480 [Mycobacterium paraense]|uniref:Haemophore haem-binding domain-containing protein n=1 Tax=Mycobacterium paraense TaxID=767916 RepID=A0ABX3VRD7_9MYCO|nr:hypothetical protein AWB91_09480 [Mycobacterium paraense]ORW44940.1 hypothetical protein AWB88_04550 [Mycobacterium paraense]
MLGGLRKLPGDDPRVIAARQRYAVVAAQAYGPALVDKLIPLWPHLPDDQRARIAELLGKQL